MRVLVTGGSGFIGSTVVDALLGAGHAPVIFDVAPSPYHAPGELERVTGSILDIAALRRAVRRCDAIVHLAAVADVDLVAANPSHADLVNARGTALVLEAARAEDVPRVLYASTIWVYGTASNGAPLDERSPLPLPAHFYTATKLAGEMYCRSYAELYGIEETILRFGIPHGPRSRERAVVATFVARALSGKALTINGDGTQARQFVYVEDLAAGVVAALGSHAIGRVYNLVGEETVSVAEIARAVREVVAEVPVVHVPPRPGDLYRARISATRAREELGWEPRVSFVEGVRRYVAWLAATNGSPSCAARARIDGSAATVLSQEAGEL
jgi:UDP-glucose 4-epimerase